MFGQFIVQYDVDLSSTGGNEIQVLDGYFVHYFAPENLQTLPRHVIFVVDVSGSMSGTKLKQTNYYHLVHNHGSIGFSGILFVSFNENLHTATRFYSPFNNFIDGSVIGYRPVVKEGDLLIWPSSILHEAESNHSEEDRIIISFNLINLRKETSK